MSNSLIFALEQKASGKKGAGESKTYRAIASTAALDRDREVLLPKGAITENFMKNPVMLFIHQYRQVPVGKVTSIDITKDAVSFEFEFADTELGNELKGLYDSGFMSAFSVGLYAQKSMWVDEQTPDVFDVTFPDGSKDTFDMSKYKTRPDRIVLAWELLEISPVPVPSNPEALLLRAKDDIKRKSVEGHLSKGASQILESSVDDQIKGLQSMIDSFFEKVKSAAPDNVIAYAKTAIDLERSWDAFKSQATLAKWASIDGSGEKESIDWGLYSKGFAFVNVAEAEKLSSYKFAHHLIVDKEMVAVYKGVTKAMADVLASKEALGADAIRVYEHLAGHYDDAGQKAPPFEADYTEEQLKAIAEGSSWELKSDEQQEEEQEHQEEESSKDALAEIKSILVEFDEVIRLRFALLADTLDSIHRDVKSIGASGSKSDEEEQQPEEEQESGDDKSLEDQLKSLSDFLKNPT
jgi:hypothetical protein